MQIRPLRPWLVALLLILIGSHAAFYLFRVSSWSELVDYEWISLLVFVTCFPAGLALLCLARPSNRPAIAVTSLAASQPTAARTRALRQLFHQPPPFGVIASLILFLVVVPMWVLQFWNLPSAGLTVDLITSDFPPPATPWPEALILRIDAHNRWYLNAALTSPSALPNDLRTELSRRAQWLVYVEADPEIPYASAIAAMEIIRAAHARVVLLPPGSK